MSSQMLRLAHCLRLAPAISICAGPHPQAMRLAVQSFSGNLLVRGGGLGGLQHLLGSSSQSPQFLLVAERKVLADDGQDSAARLAWRSIEALEAGGMGRAEGAQEFTMQAGGQEAHLPIYMLGEERGGVIKLAVDVSVLPPGSVEAGGARLHELRHLMPLLAPSELATAGHAVALSQWHQGHLFCSRCGSPMVSAEGGARRQCTSHPGHKHYPRWALPA